MKTRLWLFLMVGVCLFSMAGLAFSQDAIQLPEASGTKPDLKKEKKEDKTLTRDTAALKIKLILSQPMPIFSATLSPKLHE